ncbi:hypothetical protein FOL01_1335 [Weissella jogaejeotgali]|uniref:Uncharacterized protein n=1 Tax=Weissella jogaejeotgali TaxID=1631871 RepID=A0A1L6RCA8_9LACO|nr:hypothetical protein [Weissella jogaejeotgali]APS42194.1 hypothetical protein FOL01_1335 [Weissella jogaejeotgali]
MTDKAYIVANEKQEREVLENLEEKGALWRNGENATNFIPFRAFPYVIYCNGDKYISWDKLGDLDVDRIIVYDGRKEEQMSEKYIVSQEFMNELEEWTATRALSRASNCFVDIHDIETLPMHIETWWGVNGADTENNNRLIAIIRWMNGEDVFEVEKSKKWIVRSKEVNDDGDKHYWKLLNLRGVLEVTSTFELRLATKFDTKEEAESWANAHQEVIEVEE